MIGLEIKAQGERLVWSRNPLDMNAIRVRVPRGSDHLDVTIESGLSTEGGGSTSAPASSEHLAVVKWNEFLLLPQGIDADTLSAVATIIVPVGWSIASALDSKPLATGGYEFETTSVAHLVDSPVQLGRYSRRINLRGAEPNPSLQHSISIMADSSAAIVIPDGFEKAYSSLVAEAGTLFGSRPYRHYIWLLTLSHVFSERDGLEHHESSDNRDRADALTEPACCEGLAELLAHEYVHSWNGKYRRPYGLLSPDYQKAMDGSLLWVYEGMTAFWSNVLSARAGLITTEHYREMLAQAAAAFDTETSARWRPMADTAVAAQLLYRSTRAWESRRRSTDFYDASVFLWLDVNAEMQARSKGHVTIDDFARRFYGGSSGSPQLKPYAEQDIYDALSAETSNDWRAFIHRHLNSTGSEVLLAALERTGWRLTYSRDENAWVEYLQKDNKSTLRQWSIGVNLDKDARITDVIDGRAAARAGASPGMTIVGVNGERYSVEVLDAAIAEAQTTHNSIALLVESNDFFRTLSVAYYDGPRFPHLLRIDGSPDTLLPLLEPRVH